MRLDDETIRRHCHRAAAQRVKQRDAHPPGAAFAAAQGDIEFLTDGVMAPTRGGWRELKLARFQVRPRGGPAEVADWATRDLPDPTASVAYATTADGKAFAARWAGWARGLGIDPAGSLSVLGDGAAWIWAAAAEHFPNATQVLDIFHASQHLAIAAIALHGEETTAAAEWLDDSRRRLLADGWPGLLDQIGATPKWLAGRSPARRRWTRRSATSPSTPTAWATSADYAPVGRSAAAQSRGWPKLMGRRLKVAGRGWCIEHLDGMAALIATLGTPEWPNLWNPVAA